MQNTDKAIADFEAWAGSEAFGLSAAHFEKDDSGEYVNYPTQCYWLVWQASRAELVIELPQIAGFEGVYDSKRSLKRSTDFSDYPSGLLGADKIFSLCRITEACEAIEAAGVKVKE